MAPKRVLLVVSSAHPEMYPGGHESGLFITEALHPFNAFQAAGFEVDFASETGEYRPDWNSIQEDWLKGEDRATWENEQSGFRKKLDGLRKPADVNWNDYGIFFAAGGHATLVDFPDAKGLHDIAARMYADNRVIAAVCHGPAILPGIIDQATSKPIIAGKKVTGFTNKGEDQLGVMEKIKSWKKPLVEDAFAAAGATYVPPSGPWDCFTQTDARIVTGVNPQSAKATAEEAIKVFTSL
ncbi:class I glutamine amidotransferase-like protein [Trichodelitschia bisporula]|uniref:D-lactate dehydratase n=1 Tax=Trichodelitschia bisporula TaxID=703511 RepID=A0A6G1HPI3_9PEZI|nr:class I glutamine amidotransferase-like protein [Trichodelitschia bisporula]